MSTLKWNRTSDLPTSLCSTVLCGINTGGRGQSLPDSPYHHFLISAFRFLFCRQLVLLCRGTQSGRVCLSVSSLTHIRIFAFSFLTSFFVVVGRRAWDCWLGSWQAALNCTANLMKLLELWNCDVGFNFGFYHFPSGQDKLLYLFKSHFFIRLISISKGNFKD